MPRLQLVWVFPLLAGLLLTAGCLRSSPPPNYYALLPLSQARSAPPLMPELRLGVVVKDFPEILERVQILTREGYRIEVSDQQRWASPLRQEVEQVLGVNLRRLLGFEQVAVAPWPSYFSPTRRLLVDIVQFDGALCGELTLQARWTLTEADGKANPLQRDSTIRRRADCTGYPGYVAAQSRALADLSTEIATTLTRW